MNSVMLNQIERVKESQAITCLSKLEALGNEVGRRDVALVLSEGFHNPEDFIFDYYTHQIKYACRFTRFIRISTFIRVQETAMLNAR